MPSGDAAHVAQHRFDAVGDAVRSDVLAAVGVGPIVDVDRIDMGGTAFGGDDRQHARAAAHVESRAARNSEAGTVTVSVTDIPLRLGIPKPVRPSERTITSY